MGFPFPTYNVPLITALILVSFLALWAPVLVFKMPAVPPFCIASSISASWNRSAGQNMLICASVKI